MGLGACNFVKAFACESPRVLVGRLAQIDSRFGKKFANRHSTNGIAARIGRESRELQSESERRRDSRESGQVLQKFVFLCESIRCESIRANRFDVGVRIACPLSGPAWTLGDKCLAFL